MIRTVAVEDNVGETVGEFKLLPRETNKVLNKEKFKDPSPVTKKYTIS
jgi:hypothetical protein